MFGVSLFTLLLALVMCANGLAILSERRFLSKLGLSTDFNTPRSNADARWKIGLFLHSVRTLLRWPLIVINWICIGIVIISY